MGLLRCVLRGLGRKALARGCGQREFLRSAWWHPGRWGRHSTSMWKWSQLAQHLSPSFQNSWVCVVPLPPHSVLPTKHTLGGLLSSHKEEGQFWCLESLNFTVLPVVNYSEQGSDKGMQ